MHSNYLTENKIHCLISVKALKAYKSGNIRIASVDRTIRQYAYDMIKIMHKTGTHVKLIFMTIIDHTIL